MEDDSNCTPIKSSSIFRKYKVVEAIDPYCSRGYQTAYRSITIMLDRMEQHANEPGTHPGYGGYFRCFTSSLFQEGSFIGKGIYDA